jgi:tRNA(Ile)-lysidine synthase
LSGAGAGGRILVGCSGGPDSTALLLALAALRESLGLVLKVVAVDHRLRPEASLEAEAVCALAQKLELPAEVAVVAVPAGASRMALARAVRYEALAAAARRFAAPWIAVGHTRDDQAETMLMRLLFGAGLTGLAGMAVVSALPVQIPQGPPCRLVRPLLTVPRAEVESFLSPLRSVLDTPHGTLPFQDPTNADPHYLRTRLRSEALPLLRELAPNLDEHLLKLSEQLRADAEHLNQEAQEALVAVGGRVSEGGLTLPLAALAALPRALRARVLRLAAGGALGQRHVDALLGLCSSQAGRKALDLPGGLRVLRRRDTLLLLRPEPA